MSTTFTWGSSGTAAVNSASTESKAVVILIAAVHLSFKMSRQIAPVYSLSQEVSSNLTADVGMIYLCHEFHIGRGEGIVVL